jgi:hypothetical protein
MPHVTLNSDWGNLYAYLDIKQGNKHIKLSDPQKDLPFVIPSKHAIELIGFPLLAHLSFTAMTEHQANRWIIIRETYP